MKLIMENWKKFLKEDEQLELPGIPAGDPDQRARSLEAAQIVLRDLLQSKDDKHLISLVHAAPRVVRGLSAPLEGLKAARGRIMMDLDIDVNPEIAEQILNILKQHEPTRKAIHNIKLRLAGIHADGQINRHMALRSAEPWASDLEKEYLGLAYDETEGRSDEEDITAQIADLKE